MSSIADYLARPDSDWRFYKPTLGADGVKAALSNLDQPLPAALVELYQACDGGEGSLPFQPWRFVLWGIEDVVALRKHPFYREYHSGLTFFGSNGAGEYFGIDKPGRIFFMDAVAGEDSIRYVAESFAEFLEHIGVLPPGGVPGIDGEEPRADQFM